MVNLPDYITHSNLFRTLKIDDLLCVEYQCLIQDDSSEVWSHTNYLAYVLGGEKLWKTHRNEYKVGSGEALFVKKGANTVYQYFDEPFLVLFVFLPDHFIRQMLTKYRSVGDPSNQLKPVSPEENDTVISLSVNEVLHSFFQSLLAYFSQPKPPMKDLLKLKMEELILSVLSLPNNTRLKQYFISRGQGQQVDLQTVMNENFMHPLSIKDYARLCARSLSSFRRDFRELYQATPGQWLMDKRLEYSRFLLETSDKPVSVIMDESGFKNRSHFIRVFKEKYGTSPKQYQLRRLMNQHSD